MHERVYIKYLSRSRAWSAFFVRLRNLESWLPSQKILRFTERHHHQGKILLNEIIHLFHDFNNTFVDFYLGNLVADLSLSLRDLSPSKSVTKLATRRLRVDQISDQYQIVILSYNLLSQIWNDYFLTLLILDGWMKDIPPWLAVVVSTYVCFSNTFNQFRDSV